MHYTLKAKIIGGPHDGHYCRLEMDTHLPIETALDAMAFAEMAGGKYAIECFNRLTMTAELKFLAALPDAAQ